MLILSKLTAKERELVLEAKAELLKTLVTVAENTEGAEVWRMLFAETLKSLKLEEAYIPQGTTIVHSTCELTDQDAEVAKAARRGFNS